MLSRRQKTAASAELVARRSDAVFPMHEGMNKRRRIETCNKYSPKQDVKSAADGTRRGIKITFGEKPRGNSGGSGIGAQRLEFRCLYFRGNTDIPYMCSTLCSQILLMRQSGMLQDKVRPQVRYFCSA